MTELFNEPWMDRLDVGLLQRYWESKGRPGVLRTRGYGLNIYHLVTPHGVIRTTGIDWDQIEAWQLERNRYYSARMDALIRQAKKGKR